MTLPTAPNLSPGGDRAETPEHRRFRTLLAKLERARERLQAWQAALPGAVRDYETRVRPEIERLNALRRQHAFDVEQVLLRHKWPRADADTLGELICALVHSVLEADGEPDDELKALHDRHAEVDFDTAVQQQLQEMKDLVEQMGGVDLGDDPVGSVDELMRRAQAKLHEQGPAPDEASAERPARRKPRTAAQRRAEAAQAQVSQTVREVYRKLASALHPDRAGDVPAAERERRTTLMQRANSAYEAGDLLALLQLQWQIERLEPTHLAEFPKEQVRHFNAVLAEQLREVEAEIGHRQAAFCRSVGVPPGQRLDPHDLGRWCKERLRDVQAAQRRIEHDRRLFHGDPMGVRRFLQHWRAEHRAALRASEAE